MLGHSCYYLDTGRDPLYPFGFGLRYTTFCLSDIRLQASDVPQDGIIGVSVAVANTGLRLGVEVVQLYVGDPQASVTRPVKELKAYRRVELAPGESRRVEFEIPVSALAFRDSGMRWVTEPGEYVLTLGAESTVGQTVSVEVLP